MDLPDNKGLTSHTFSCQNPTPRHKTKDLGEDVIIPETWRGHPFPPIAPGNRQGKRSIAEEARTKLGMFKGARDGSPRWVLGSEN